MPDDVTLITERLSPRQRDCLLLVFERRTSKEIAAELGIGVGTVDSYIAEAVALLGAKNRRRAAELLFSVGTPRPLEILQPQSTGASLSAHGSLSPELGRQPRDRLELIPFRLAGIARNEFKPVQRLFWILQLAFGFAISFGMLVTGLDIISRWLGTR